MGAFITEDQIDNLSADTVDQAPAVPAATPVATPVTKTEGAASPAGGAKPDQASDPAEGAPKTDVAGGEQVAKAMPEDLKTATAEVVAWLKQAGKTEGAPAGAIGKVAAFLTSSAAQKAEVKKAEAAPVAPVDPIVEELPTVQVFDDGRVVVAGKPIAKSRRFTETRTKKLTEMAASVCGLLKEVDEEAFKSLMSGFGEIIDAGELAPVAPVAKAAEPEAKPDKLADIEKRLADIEKTRAPSKADGAEGTATTEPVAKTDKKGIWGGVLWPSS